jgi:hypothetical protein
MRADLAHVHLARADPCCADPCCPISATRLADTPANDAPGRPRGVPSADMTTWEDLSTELARLAAQTPGPLTSWPDPEQNGGQPPFDIELEPWAIDVAQDLHTRFGSAVRLMVGALHYPERVLPGPPPPVSQAPQLDPEELAVELDGPLTIRSGTAAHHGLLIRNLGDRDVVVGTTGELIADVIDPASGKVVGGYQGAVRLMLQTFTVQPGATQRIPLLVATASLVPELGYAIPPGQWGAQATLDPAAGQAVRTPPLPITITA